MKRIISALICVAMLLSCTACSTIEIVVDNETSSTEETKHTQSNVTESAPETDAPETSAPETTVTETDAPKTEPPKTEVPATTTNAPATTPGKYQPVGALVAPGSYDYTFNTSGTVGETVLFDNEYAKVTVTGITYDDYRAVIGFKMENKTDQIIKLSNNSSVVFVNKLEDSSYLSETLEPKSTVETELRLYLDQLLLMGVNALAHIDMTFLIEDDEYEELATVPVSFDTSAAADYKYDEMAFYNAVNHAKAMEDNEYQVLYANKNVAEDSANGMKIASVAVVRQKVSDNDYGGVVLLCEIVNTGSTPLKTGCGYLTANGIVVDGYSNYSEDLPAGYRTVKILGITTTLPYTAWTSFGINDIYSIDFAVEKCNDYFDLLSTLPVHVDISAGTPAVNKDGTEVYNKNNIKVISKGKTQDDDCIYFSFLVENNTGKEILMSDVYDSFKVNGEAADNWGYDNVRIKNGHCGSFLMTVEKGEDNPLTMESVSNIEFAVDILLIDYNRIESEAVIKVTY